jgi:hypothetical protein
MVSEKMGGFPGLKGGIDAPPLFKGKSTEIGYVYKESTIPYFFL